jgi:cellulose synthase (UDP-forming)
MMFWLFPLPRMIFMLAPLLHIFFDVRIFTSSIDETIAYTATYMVVNVMIQSYLFGHVRWPWMSELYEYVQGMFLLGAIVSVVTSPRKPTFNVTAKGVSLDRDHLSSLALPFFAAFLILGAGVGTAAYRYAFEPGVTSLMLVVGLWSAVNLLVAGVALGVVAERRQVDRYSRLEIDRKGTLTFQDCSIDVAIVSVSAGGCSIQTSEPSALRSAAETHSAGSLTVITLDDRASPAPIPVRLVDAGAAVELTRHALTFERLEAEHYFGLAELMYGDGNSIARFLADRRARKTFLQATLQFVAWGFEGPMRALRYWLRSRSAGPAAVADLLADPHRMAALPLDVATADVEQGAGTLAARPASVVHPGFSGPAREPMYDAWMLSMLALAAEELKIDTGKERAAGAALRVA